MDYFKPDFYRNFQSADDQISDKAEADIEEAWANYKTYLEGVQPLPENVNKLISLFSNNDYVVDLVEIGNGNIVVKIFDNYVEGQITITYHKPKLGRKIVDYVEHQHEKPIQSGQPCLIYDEIIVRDEEDGSKLYRHSFLTGDGTERQIYFFDVTIS